MYPVVSEVVGSVRMSATIEPAQEDARQIPPERQDCASVGLLTRRITCNANPPANSPWDRLQGSHCATSNVAAQMEVAGTEGTWT